MTRQKGNALWVILIAIALIGGLTAMFTRSSSTSDETGDYEKKTIEASKILRYAKSLELGVQQLLQKGCSENQLSFWFDSNGDGAENGSDTYYNSSAPTDRSCHVFAPEGAGLTFLTAQQLFPGQTWTGGASAYNEFAAKSALLDVGTSKAEIYWLTELPSSVNRAEFCKALNAGMGHSITTPPVTGLWGTAFTGTFPTPDPVNIAALSGKSGYCYSYSPDTARYLFYYILHVR